MRAKEFISEKILDELNIDNRNGWGQTPNNANIDYGGLKVWMKPSTFLNLAVQLPIDDEAKETIEKMKQHAETGGTFGAPSLYIAAPRSWDNNNCNEPATVTSHEGRHRMNAQLATEGNVPVETHIIINGEWRHRDFTPEVIAALNEKLVKERSNQILFGPFFKVM